MFFRNLFNKFFLLMPLDRRFFIGGEFLEDASGTATFRRFYYGLRIRSWQHTWFPIFAIAALVSLLAWSPLVAIGSFSAFIAYMATDAVRLHDRWIARRHLSFQGTYRDHPAVPGKLFLLPGSLLLPLLICVGLFRAAFVLTPLVASTVQAAEPEPAPRSGFIFLVAADIDPHMEGSAVFMSAEFIDEMGDRGIPVATHGTAWTMDSVRCQYFDEACIWAAADFMQVDYLYFGFVNRLYTLEGEIFAVDIYRFDNRSSEMVHASYDCGTSVRSGQLCMEQAAEYFSSH